MSRPTQLEALYEGGLLLIDKPKGLSSFGVIEKIQSALMRSLGVKKKDTPKMGHGGTLDPFATGLLPICIGGGVKLSRYFLESNKEYTGRIVFGSTTLSGDVTDAITEKTDHLPADLPSIQKVAQTFVGVDYAQIPPMHSAKKIGGKPLYELARQGIEVERAPRVCRLFEFRISNYEAGQAEFKVRCSSGTYIRTLAQDLAVRLGTLAHLTELRRTQTGIKRIEDAETLDALCQKLSDGSFQPQTAAFIPFQDMLNGFDTISVTEPESWSITRGQQDVLTPILARKDELLPGRRWKDQDVIVLKKKDQKLLAVLRLEKDQWGLERVLTTEA